MTNPTPETPQARLERALDAVQAAVDNARALLAEDGWCDVPCGVQETLAALRQAIEQRAKS